MTITINDKPYELQSSGSLASFLTDAGLPTEGVAIALADCVIPREEWSRLQLAEGMQFIMIHAVSGG